MTIATTTHSDTAAPAPFEVPGPFSAVPSLEELYRLTEIPDRRVVFRGVDWSFYERLVDSIPESTSIQADFDGKDLEIMGKGRKHGKFVGLLGQLVEAVAQESSIPYSSLTDTTWKRRQTQRGLEADQSFYFSPEKIAADATALDRDSNNIDDYPNPDLAIEVDFSPPQIDRTGIYAALCVAEVWRFDGHEMVIERLTADGIYQAVAASGFLPIRTEDVHRWLVEEDTRDESAWRCRLRAEIGQKKDRT